MPIGFCLMYIFFLYFSLNSNIFCTVYVKDSVPDSNIGSNSLIILIWRSSFKFLSAHSTQQTRHFSCRQGREGGRSILLSWKPVLISKRKQKCAKMFNWGSITLNNIHHEEVKQCAPTISKVCTRDMLNYFTVPEMRCNLSVFCIP